MSLRRLCDAGAIRSKAKRIAKVGLAVKSVAKALSPWFEIICGSLLTAVGANLFLVPFKLADGGILGLAVVLYYLLRVPVSVTVLALNVPLFILGLLTLGFRFIARTFFGVLALSVALEATKDLVAFKVANDVFLATLYAGVLTGIGIGLVIRAGGSTGGSDALARIIAQRTRFTVGQVLLAIDAAVIGSAGLVFGVELALYGAVTLFVASRVVDFVVGGAYAARLAIIITDRPKEVADLIASSLSRGATIFQAVGAYTGKPRQVVYTVVSRDQLVGLKFIVRQVDPKAFVVVADATEVLGEGFTPP